MDLPTRLRIELALYGKSPGELAELAGIHPTSISRILNGHQVPMPETLRKIEDAIRHEAVPS